MDTVLSPPLLQPIYICHTDRGQRDSDVNQFLAALQSLLE